MPECHITTLKRDYNTAEHNWKISYSAEPSITTRYSTKIIINDPTNESSLILWPQFSKWF